MSTETDKRCGTCKFWVNIWADQSIGDCGVILPHSLVAPEQEMMTANEGTNCPCWGPKQCAENESFQDYSKRAIAKIAEDAGLTVEQLTAKIIG